MFDHSWLRSCVRYGYRRITAMLRNDRWVANTKRVERIWRRKGLKVPQKQPKRGDFGSMMDRACGYVRNIVAMSGVTTSWLTAPMTEKPSACLR